VSDIYRIRRPEDTIVVIPTTLEYVYDQDRDGGDVLGILFDAKKTGPMQLTLNASMAQHIIAGLNAMLNDLDNLRREHHERNPQ
jgi:hypothetical protein